jgi:hypothetical protein
LGLRPEEVRPGRLTYDLRRLRLHGLIVRIPKTHRYRFTPTGLRTALFYTRIYARVLRPGLALVSPAAPDHHPQLTRAFQAAEDAVNAWCNHAKIAA